MQASSEGKTRGARRTRPAGKAKEKVTKERVNMKAKEEDLATKENSKRRERGGTGPNGAKHGGRLTPPGHVGSGEGREQTAQ